MDIQKLSEMILEHNIRRRLLDPNVKKATDHIEGDYVEYFKTTEAWTQQVEHLTKELGALEPGTLEILAERVSLTKPKDSV